MSAKLERDTENLLNYTCHLLFNSSPQGDYEVNSWGVLLYILEKYVSM